MNQGRTTLMMVLLLFAHSAAVAAPLSYVVFGPGGKAQDLFFSSLHAQLGAEVVRIDQAPDLAEASELAEAPDLAVAIGAKGLEQACKKKLPVIATQVGSRDIKTWRARDCSAVAVFSYADPATQFSLQKRLLPSAKRVGVLLSDKTLHLKSALERHAESVNVMLLVEEVDDAELLSAALANLMARADVVIALPDSRIFNADNARLLLMAGYRQGKPIIGPDDHWVRAGSLASSYIPIENLIDAFASKVFQFKRTGKLGSDRFPEADFLFNESVANALSIPIPDDKTLRNKGGGQ